MNANNTDRLRLTGRDGLGLAGLILFGVASLLLGLHLFPSVFPEASIRFEVDRSESKTMAESFLRDRDIDVSSHRHACVFRHDDTAKVFLERELGLEEMDTAIEKTAKIWSWSHRWFKPLNVEEFRVDIAPTGELVRFEHLLADSAEGANLTEDDARRLAERRVHDLRPEGLNDLTFLGATSRRLDNRTDHLFTWERAGVDWAGGTYRHRVTIRGDELGGYEEFVKVPEDWNREYSRLRSNNTVAGAVGSVFYILTIVAMLLVLFVEMRRKRLRWRFALVLGIVGAALTLLSSVSGLQRTFYFYDTSDAFGGFIAAVSISSLLSALAAGVLIVLVVATGENQYRLHYPNKLSLPAFFTWRGLRTKEFLFSAIAGLVLTCGFLAYQTVFYRVASSFGAWSPAEVPYTDLLNSAYPWAFLLFIGYFPAVSEEFMSRAFSIPFFSRILKNRAFAVILASLIWGLLHAAYPNQPFYIRVLELTIAGAFVSILMLRFNVLMLLVWHYTVDAVYSGYLLFVSGDTYYVASASVVGGILVLPVVVAVVSYLRTRRFTDPEEMRHIAEQGDELPESPAPPSVPITIDVEPVGRRRAVIAVITSAAVLVVALGLSNGWKEKGIDAPIAIDRETAMSSAIEFVGERGIDTERFRRSIQFSSRIDPDAARYVLKEEGFERLGFLWPEPLAAHAWDVRFYEPLKTEEINLGLDANSGRIISFEHRIAEGDSLPNARASLAESLAVDLLASVGLTTGGMELKEDSEEPRPRRMDRRYAWEAADGDGRNVSDARYRLEASVTGDRAAGIEEILRLPEEYTRARSKRTLFWGLALVLVLLSSGAVLGVSIYNSIRTRAGGAVRLKRFIPIGIAGAVISVIASANALPRLLHRYDTSMPWSNYMILILAGLFAGMVLYFFFGWMGAALGMRLHPTVTAITDSESRRKMIPGALLAVILTPVWVTVIARINLLLAAYFPGVASPPLPVGGGSLETAIPAVGIVTTSLVRAFIFCLVVGLIIHLLRSSEWMKKGLRYLILAAAVVGFALLPANGSGEFAINLVTYAVLLVIAYGLARYLFRDNPLAYVAGVYGVYVLDGVGDLITQPDRWVQGHAIAAGVILLLPVIWFAVSSRRRSGVA